MASWLISAQNKSIGYFVFCRAMVKGYMHIFPCAVYTPATMWL